MQRLRRDVRAAGAAFLTERKYRLKPVFRGIGESNAFCNAVYAEPGSLQIENHNPKNGNTHYQTNK